MAKGIANSIPTDQFLLCCIDCVKNNSIDYTAIAKATGYSTKSGVKRRLNRIRAQNKSLVTQGKVADDNASTAAPPKPAKTVTFATGTKKGTRRSKTKPLTIKTKAQSKRPQPERNRKSMRMGKKRLTRSVTKGKLVPRML